MNEDFNEYLKDLENRIKELENKMRNLEDCICDEEENDK